MAKTKKATNPEAADEAALQTKENQENLLILMALADVFGVEDFDEAFKAASKLKANVDSGILVYAYSEAVAVQIAKLETRITELEKCDCDSPPPNAPKRTVVIETLARLRAELKELKSRQVEVLYITTDYGKIYTCRTVEGLGIFLRNYKKAHPNIGLSISYGRMTEGEYSKIPLDKFFVDNRSATAAVMASTVGAKIM